MNQLKILYLTLKVIYEKVIPFVFTDDVKLQPIIKLLRWDGSTGGVAKMNSKPVRMAATVI